MVNPRVFMDITIGGNSAGRIVIELFADPTPKTAEKFRLLCTGEKGPDLHYKGSTFHCVVYGLCVGGKVKADKLESVNGGVNFQPEKLLNKNDGPGTVSMLGPTEGPIRSEFFTTTKCLSHNYDIHVVVGKVVKGINVVNAIHNFRSSIGTPSSPIVIADCGELRELTPISLEYDQLASTSNKQLSSCVKEIMDLNKQFALDPNDGHYPENEDKLVETAEIFQRNLDVLADLKAEVCSLEKRQNELLSLTKTEISIAKKRKFVLDMIPSLSYDDLVNMEDVIKKSKSDC